MTDGIVHSFISGKSDGGDATLVRPSDWNDDHDVNFVAPAGLTGATAASRYVGATASGAPASGTFATGDFVVDQTGVFWICTAGGSPGTWVNPNAGGGGLYAIDETFPGVSLPAGWAFTGSGSAPVSGGVAAFTGAAQSDRLLFTYSPVDLYVVRMHVQNITGEGGMPSLCILDSSGNGWGVGPYNDANTYGWDINTYAYVGTNTALTSSPSLTDVWLEISVISGNAASGAISTDGSTWTGLPLQTGTARTITKVGFIQAFNAANSTADIVELTITEP